MLFFVATNSELVQPNIENQFKKLVLKRLLFNNILVLLIQYSGLNLSNLSPSFSPVWFATGTACAFLFLRGCSVLPGIWLGNFLAYFLAHAGIGLAISFSTVISLQAVLLLWFSYRYLSPTLVFYKLQMYIKFIIFTVLLTAITSLMLAFLYSLAILDQKILFTVWLHYWLGNLNAILIFSCMYNTWDTYFSCFYTLKSPHKLLRILLYMLLVSITVALVFNTTQIIMFFLAATNLLITLVISSILGWCGAITALFLSAMLLSFAAFLGAPVFYTPFSSSTGFFLQLFLCGEAIISLSIAIQRKKH